MTKNVYMDQLKAQRLILRIQTLLDQEQTLSKLESDLIRSYIIQLYDAVTDSESVSAPSVSASSSPQPSADQPAPPRPEPVPVIVPPVQPPQPPASKPVWEPMAETPAMSETPPAPAPVPEPSPVSTPVVETPAPEPAQAPAGPASRPGSTDQFSEALVHLFDPPAHSSPTAAHVVISSIEEVMGLNDRIFTLKDLFGGDKSLFDETLAKLNALSSFREARQLLLEGVASRHDWANPERVKMAVEFIRIVRRRYPPES